MDPQLVIDAEDARDGEGVGRAEGTGDGKPKAKAARPQSGPGVFPRLSPFQFMFSRLMGYPEPDRDH